MSWWPFGDNKKKPVRAAEPAPRRRLTDPDDEPAAAPAKLVAVGGKAVEEEPSNALSQLPSVFRARLERIPKAPGFLDEDALLRLEEPRDEYELSRIIARDVPGASADEVQFRYHLSRIVYRGEFDLPPLPDSTARIMDLARRDGTGATDYAKVVETDPILTKEVLGLANSSYYGAKVKCTSVAQALVRIGLREVERIALMQSFESRMFRVRGHNETVNQLGRHGLAVALASQNIARRSGADPEAAYLAGLYHDIGKMYVLGAIAVVQRELQRTASAALVRAAFDAFHVVMGERMCVRWELPDPVIHAVSVHHESESAARGSGVDRAVYLGNRLAHALLIKGSADKISGPDDPVAKAAGIDLEQLEELREETADQMRAYMRVLR